VLRVRFAITAIANFIRRKYSVQKHVVVLLDHLDDARTLSDICADANYVHLENSN
jgi:hypothetical protein